MRPWPGRAPYPPRVPQQARALTELGGKAAHPERRSVGDGCGQACEELTITSSTGVEADAALFMSVRGIAALVSPTGINHLIPIGRRPVQMPRGFSFTAEHEPIGLA